MLLYWWQILLPYLRRLHSFRIDSRKEMREQLARKRKAARISSGVYGTRSRFCSAPQYPATALLLCTLGMINLSCATPSSHRNTAYPAFSTTWLYGTRSRKVCIICAPHSNRGLKVEFFQFCYQSKFVCIVR